MSDELVKRLRAWDGSPFDEEAHAAADRIEQLVATNKQLTAERYRLRDALEYILAECTLSDNTMPSVGAIKYAARAAMKGEI